MALNEKNLILAIVLSVAILLGFQILVQGPRDAERRAQLATQQAAPEATTPAPIDPDLPLPEGGVPEIVIDRDSIAAATPRVEIESPQLRGSINLAGGRIDDLTLVGFRETTEPGSANITLLSPAGASDPYFAEFGWVTQQGAAFGGGSGTIWTALDDGPLAPDNPVRMTWDNGEGLRLTRTYAIDDQYMFTIVQEAENTGSESVSLFPFGRITRVNTPDTLGFYILHEGPIGVLDDRLDEVDYDDLQDEQVMEKDTTGGWIGITDKYWLTALVPDQQAPVKTRFIYNQRNSIDRYQADYLGDAVTIAPGESAAVTNRLFAGAKQVTVLERYRKELGIARFDMAIDFGWFFFLTKPLLFVLLAFAEGLGNFGLAILALTVIIKLAFFPLANKSYKSMSRMKALQPQMTELRERFSEDRQKMQQELMALYKREKVNPVAGCLPMVIQIPVFFALYKVLFVSIEMRQAPFFGWITDLSVADPTNIFNLFGLLPFVAPSFLHLGAWPLIMGISMFLQQKLNPAPADPVQAKVFMLMPVIFTVLLANFPAGLVIYWAWNNTLSMAQQYVIMRKMGVAVGGGTTK